MNFSEMEEEKQAQTAHFCKSLIIGMIPIYLMAAVYYGWNVLVIGVLSAVACQLLDYICLAVARRNTENDFSAIATGLALGLLMPATASWPLVLLACFGAICVAKHPFGGTHSSPFSPAAVGFCLACVCFPAKMLTYPLPFAYLTPLGEGESLRLTYSTVHLLAQGAQPAGDWMDLLLGQSAGPLGQSSLLVLLGCLLFLLVRRAVDWRVVLSACLTAGLFAGVFPRSELDFYQAVFYELTGGTLLFSLIFLASWPGSLPKTGYARILFGGLFGLTGMLFRYFGQLDLGFLFALVVCNSLTPSLDAMADALSQTVKKAPKLIGWTQKYVNRSLTKEEEVKPDANS